MSYKLLEVASFYSKYLDDFYQKNDQIKFLSYEEHYKLLVNDCFAECDFIHPELQKFNVESKLVIYNDEKLQRKWKEENTYTTLFEILCGQIKEYKPDIIYFSDINVLTINQYDRLKELIPSTCKLIGWHFTIVNNSLKKLFSCFDQIYTGSKYIQSLLKPYCKNVQLLYHGFAPGILSKVLSTPRANKLVFPGSIFIGEKIHNNRIDMFGQLYKQNIPCDFYGNIYGSFVPHTFKQYAKWLLIFNKPSKNRIETEKKLLQSIKPSVFGLDYYNVINSYNICINQHAAIAGTGSGNMRMFEATGMGICLLTDYREENIDLFKCDEEIVVYNNYDELVDKAKYLINNPIKAQEIAKNGQNKTLNKYSYKQKAEKMNEYILELLSNE